MEVSIKVEKRDTPPKIEGWGPFKKVVVPVKTVWGVYASFTLTPEEKKAIETLGLKNYEVWEKPKSYKEEDGKLREWRSWFYGMQIYDSNGQFVHVLDCPNLGSANAVEKVFKEAIEAFAVRLKYSDQRENRTNTFQV